MSNSSFRRVNASVWSVHEDAVGTLWVGTFTGGVNVSTPNSGAIRHYHAVPGDPITFYVSTNPPQQYSLDVYRIGYYGGAGGRLMQHLEGFGTTQPT